jgi:hypothetical protein
MDPARLPPVINEVVQPKEERKEEPKEERKEEPKDAPSRIIIVHAKDIKPLDKETLKQWGSVLMLEDHYQNIPFASLPPHTYLLVDIHNKLARRALEKEDLSNTPIVCYVAWYQRDEDFIKKLNGHIITSFPNKAISKDDFEQKLLADQLIPPSKWRLFLRWVLPRCLEVL